MFYLSKLLEASESLQPGYSSSTSAFQLQPLILQVVKKIIFACTLNFLSCNFRLLLLYYLSLHGSFLYIQRLP